MPIGLDIRTFVQVALVLTILGIVFFIWLGIRSIRSARGLKFFRMRRDRMVRGWRSVFIAVFLVLLAFFLNSFAEPIAYHFFPPTATVTTTPTTSLTPTHTGHFNSDFQAEFAQFSTALTSQLVSVPLPSPASGFTYEFDPGLGVFTRTTKSFGPILAERAETIGARQTSFGFTFQQFTFDTIEGIDLGNVPAVFTHDNPTAGTGRADVVTTANAIQARVNQFTAFLTYGVTNRLDLSIAVPIVSNDLTVVSDATIQRIGTTDERTHFFRSSNNVIGDRRTFTAFGSASGIGDITVRLKQTLAKRGAKAG